MHTVLGTGRTINRIMVVAFMIGMLGCSSKKADRAPFVGKWVGPAALLQTQFFEDGTFIQSGPASSNAGNYHIVQEGGAKYLKMDFKMGTHMYEIVDISPNLIRLKEGDNPARQLERLGD